jgi:hypothetical protein
MKYPTLHKDLEDHIYMLIDYRRMLITVQYQVFTLTNDSDRQIVLGGNKPHILYLWPLLEENDLLDNTLMVIPKEISASCEIVPGTVTYLTPSRKRTKQNGDQYLEDTRLFQFDVKSSFVELAKSSAS